MSICFLLCVERGPLESQSLLCVESLRAFGGSLAGSPVYAFAPRSGQGPSAGTVGPFRFADAWICAREAARADDRTAPSPVARRPGVAAAPYPRPV
jgi:hypothetical protein